MAKCFLSVDGGGTGTQYVLVSAAGDVLATFETGSTSAKSVGAETAAENIASGARRLQEETGRLGIALDDVRGVWGLSGNDTPQDQVAYEAMVHAAGLSLQRHLVCNDSLLALRAVTMGPGIIVIAGTGSVAVGVDAGGIMHRIGGWGYQFSDLGSGTWMGARLLKQALLWADGCAPYQPVFDEVCQKLACDKAGLGVAAASLRGADQLASLARVVLESCEGAGASQAEADAGLMQETGANQVTCATIRNLGAGYLADYAASMAATLRNAGCEDFPVVLAGGLFKNAAFLQCASQLISQRAGILEHQVVHLEVSPLEGGLNIARALEG